MSETNNIDITRDMRERARFLRHSFIESLETHLLSLESCLLEHKVNVRWVQEESSLLSTIADLLPNRQYNTLCIDLPKNIDLSNGMIGVSNSYPIESVANHEYEVDTLILDADFAIAENGSLVFIDKASKDCFNLVNNIIVILNIDRIIVSQSDLSLFLRLKNDPEKGDFPKDIKILTSSFEKVVSDAFLSSDSAGFTKEKVNLSVIFYENGVTDILQDVSLRESLYCIDCGRCASVCPVTKATQGRSPIELVKCNCFDQFNKTQSIFQQTTLCGNCQEVCPVGIPLIDLLTYEMNLVNDNVSYNKTKKLFSLLSKRGKINKYNSPFFRFFFVKRFFAKNKMLMNYFDKQKDQFYNITRNSEVKDNEPAEL